MNRIANSLRQAVVCLLAALAFLGAAELAHAQDGSPVSRGIDVVILLDDSGSMATCWPWTGPLRVENCLGSQNPPSDPLDLRYSAARLLAQLAADDDRIAVVRFNAATEGVIGQLQPVGASKSRQALVEAIRAPGDPKDYEAAGGYTRIDLGFQLAEKILAAAKAPDRPSFILFLTDGVPTQPGNVPKQDAAIKKTLAKLQANGTQVFPVLLCNAKAGCPDDSFVKRVIGTVPEKATSAADLLQVFSGLFAQMKPDLHVVDRRNARGELELTTRPPQGAQKLVIVAETDGLVALKRDGNPEIVSRAYQDGNILFNFLEADKLLPGTWTVETRGPSSFVVAQTETYPELVFPPPSVPGSAAAPHYVPSGKPVAIVAKIVGPGSAEPVRLDGTTTLTPLVPGASPLLWTVIPGAPGSLKLQVGEDTQPLQIQRQFRVEARPELPTALALAPAQAASCPSEAPCPLRAGFGPGNDITNVQGIVYVTDESEGGKPVYSAPMTCTGRECVDPAQGFKRLDGHTYTLRFFLQARAGDVTFGDWAETTLAMEPAVYVRGLPAPLNLKAQPSGGWPVTVTVGTKEDLGRMWATIALTRTEDSTAVADAQVHFAATIASPGEQQTTLRVELPTELRPGQYEGQIVFATDETPAGTGAKVRLPEPVAVNLNLPRPAAQVLSTAVDFGNVIFDTSPNFRVDQTVPINVNFSKAPFNIRPVMENSSCPGLELVAGEPRAAGAGYQVPISLRSSGPIEPQMCSGTFTLQAPSEDYDVQPAALPIRWRLAIPAVEWGVLGIEVNGRPGEDLALGRLGRPGERGSAVLQVRYTGRPPFSLNLAGLEGKTDVGEASIGDANLELVTDAVTPEPGTPDVYRVPVALVVREPLSQATQAAGWLLGTNYNGKLRLEVAGLPASKTQEISFSLHNPGRYQRYIQPFYRIWWPGIVTCPLSVLIPLVVLVMVWMRKKNADVERLMRQEGPEEAGPRQEQEQPGPAPRPAPAWQAAGPYAALSDRGPRRPRVPSEARTSSAKRAPRASEGVKMGNTSPTVVSASLPRRPTGTSTTRR